MRATALSESVFAAEERLRRRNVSYQALSTR